MEKGRPSQTKHVLRGLVPLKGIGLWSEVHLSMTWKHGYLLVGYSNGIHGNMNGRVPEKVVNKDRQSLTDLSSAIPLGFLLF